ncbi:hypothetical protein FPV67DRAFT_1654105 [Lyophyllum atratum]|nr:hypothetical protein FPV67DRAFT_1654105 [Lyophyllum atratum]
MAHCLKVVELQNLIIEHLEAGCTTDDPPHAEYFATLASLARTSSIFTEAALDALWREQPSLAYLIQVMPDDLWTIAIEPELRSGTGGVTKTVETLTSKRHRLVTIWVLLAQGPVLRVSPTRRRSYGEIPGPAQSPGLNNLQSLLIPGDWNVTPDLIDHLGNLTGLQRCEKILIDSTMASLQLRQLFTTDGGRFSKLRHLSLQTSSPEQAADVIQSLQLPLEHLSIDSWRFGSEAESFSSVSRLMESFRESQVLYVSDSLHETSPDSLYNFTSLFLLKALRELYLHWETNSPFDNDWLADAAMAWPHLSSLILDSLYHETPVVTLAGLVPLIRHCPQLSHLSLTLDAKPFGRDQDDLLAGICNRRITSLVVPYSLITDPEGVFQCLQLMFPCLTSIDYQISYETDQEGDWDRLVELLPPNDTKQRRDQSLKDLRDMQFLDIDEEMIQAFANLF